jgi:hypothetical protein
MTGTSVDHDPIDDVDVRPPFKPPGLRGCDHEEAVERMTEWFFANFEDPAESTPWDEGEYVYIWGGPYDAREEIEAAFGNTASEQAIDEAVEAIESDGYEWAPNVCRLGPTERNPA